MESDPKSRGQRDTAILARLAGMEMGGGGGSVSPE
jgi:hypothetical protein